MLAWSETLAVGALDYGVRSCGFESNQLLPREVDSLVPRPAGEGFNIGFRLPPAPPWTN